MSIAEMLSPRVLMTLDLAGKPLPDKHGAPLRLIDPARYGYKSAKLITSLTFVEWATMQAARRARPGLSVVSFGIRSKVKPFSSLLIYTDQDAANVIPTQGDMLGSYVDLEVFYLYLLNEFEKYVEYRKNTAYLFVGEGMDEMLVIAPPDCPILTHNKPVRLAQIYSDCKTWLNLGDA